MELIKILDKEDGLVLHDAALGCPLIYNPDFSDRPYVDWEKVRQVFYD